MILKDFLLKTVANFTLKTVAKKTNKNFSHLNGKANIWKAPAGLVAIFLVIIHTAIAILCSVPESTQSSMMIKSEPKKTIKPTVKQT